MSHDFTQYAIVQQQVNDILLRAQIDIRKIFAANERAVDRRIELLHEELATQLAAVGIHVQHDFEPVSPVLKTRQIMVLVAARFGVTSDDILGNSHKPLYVIPRQLAMYLSYKYVPKGRAWVGEQFGGRDPSTVQHACERTQERLTQDGDFRALAQQIEVDLGGDPVVRKPSPMKGKSLTPEQKEKNQKGTEERHGRDQRRT